MKQLRKFLRLTSRERQLVINTFILLGLIRLGLWLLPFQTLRRLIAKISQPSLQAQGVNQTNLSKIVGAVNLSSRYMPGGVKCLARALTTQVLMSRCGYSPQLRIGVAKGEGGKLEAHAWVENQGQVVIGYLRDLSRFTPLPSFKGGKL
ncbi:MAG: lasso peptide biosynthesis B2 protein [Moorea sp. SIO4G2]|uniref:lasso peptide biosynthesis B2 protein n=1 Tax=Moorena sp. SIO4A5 TaxID=2607838 RepID=UPI0013CD86FA|nr:lasso peptide biosynthesis B2 protein [Moorena sp. SIO4A5]NEO22845.1 lasso peptide biosynthesis B2 protein [Moorena sp. SIO4A5]NEO65957.1 lasso peptide biosynthesis B2 protein [Moorena sp. SIO4G2]